MLSIVKGVSRNRNISEFGINYQVSTYGTSLSKLHDIGRLDPQSISGQSTVVLQSVNDQSANEQAVLIIYLF